MRLRESRSAWMSWRAVSRERRSCIRSKRERRGVGVGVEEPAVVVGKGGGVMLRAGEGEGREASTAEIVGL